MTDKTPGQQLLELVFRRLVYHYGFPANRQFVLRDWAGSSHAEMAT